MKKHKVEKKGGVTVAPVTGHPSYKWRVTYSEGGKRKQKYFKKKDGDDGATLFALEGCLKGGSGTGATQQMAGLELGPPAPIIHTACDFLDRAAFAGGVPASTPGTQDAPTYAHGLATSGLFDTEWQVCLESVITDTSRGGSITLPSFAPDTRQYRKRDEVTSYPIFLKVLQSVL